MPPIPKISKSPPTPPSVIPRATDQDILAMWAIVRHQHASILRTAKAGQDRYGRQAVMTAIVSNTRGVSDLLGLAVLLRETGLATAEGQCALNLVPLFEQYGVDVVFNGHDHHYERSYKDGVYYIVTGGGGVVGFEPRALLEAWPWLVVFALIWMLPVVWLTIFGAGRLEPGRVAIFLMFEIVVGLTTATLLTDEPFGRREFVGALLIMGASGVEIVVEPPEARRLRSG